MIASAVTLSLPLPAISVAIAISSGTARTTVLRRQAVRDFVVGQHRPQAVGTQQHHVARLQAGRRDTSTFGSVGAPRQLYSLLRSGGWRARRVGLALGDQGLDVRMVARAARIWPRRIQYRRESPQCAQIALLCWIRQATIVVRGVSGRLLTAR